MTPTSSSWLNIVERFFRDPNQNQLSREVFRDEEWIRAIPGYLDKHNGSPKPFVWRAEAADILETSSVPTKRSILVNLVAAEH